MYPAGNGGGSTGGMQGLDPQICRSEHTKLVQAADRIQGVIANVNAVATALSDAWKGTDATTFEGKVKGDLHTQAMTVHSHLTDLAATLLRNINDQEHASAN